MAEQIRINSKTYAPIGTGGGSGDMLKSVYDKNDDGIVDNAKCSDKLNQYDTRNTNETPSWYLANHPSGSIQEFKNSDLIGIVGTAMLIPVMTIIPWVDSTGGYPIQYANYKNVLYHRTGYSNTTWNNWSIVWTSTNDGHSSGLDADTTDSEHLGNRYNWNTNNVLSTVVGQLAWKNYGNGHTIFDASQSLSPTGTAINNKNSELPWISAYPTLMGWNGANTHGLRVDSARNADSLNGIASSGFAKYYDMTGQYVDLNTLITPGVYNSIQSDLTTNKPEGSWGTVYVSFIAHSRWTQQLWLGQLGSMWIRHSSDGGGNGAVGNWNPWRSITPLYGTSTPSTLVDGQVYYVYE